MKVHNLIIERKPSYSEDYPNQLVGLVQLKGEHGKQEIRLSSGTLSRIFALIKEDAQRVANYNSSNVSHAIEEASNEAPLLEATDLDTL